MIHLQQAGRTFRSRRGDVQALDEVTFEVKEGEFVVVRGPSGSGKTTLLLLIGGMLRPTHGQVVVNGCDVYGLGERERAAFRAAHVGFVFQMFHLVPYLSAVENVMLARGGDHKQASTAQAQDLLGRLGLDDRLHHKPSELSAGERQRVALARAMLNRPGLVLADEPTGNLDPESAERVFEALAVFHREGGTVVVVTHGSGADRFAGRGLYLRQGRIELLEGTSS